MEYAELVIHEFQKVVERGGESTEAQIRAAIQRHTELGFIFAGSKTTLLNDMTLNPARPFYRLGVRHFLGPLPRGEFLQFITRGFEGGKYRVDAGAVRDILDLAEDVPYNVQALSSVAWELLGDAAVHERGVAMTSASVTQKYRVSASTMSKTLRFLESREILRREKQKDSFRWRLEDPFFAAWLRD